MDLMTILLLVIFAFFIFTMFRRNKKAQAQQAQMQSKFVPGVEVMTSFGLFGRIVSFDDVENKVVLELSPGTTATVHRQAVSKIVEPTETPADEDSTGATTEPTLGATHSPSADHAADKPVTPESQLNETPEQTLRRLEGEGK
jgi:preprotein translocase subunit YajC